jgi:hypothetical protein
MRNVFPRQAALSGEKPLAAGHTVNVQAEPKPSEARREKKVGKCR